MALRKIAVQGDECLRKVCRPVTDFNQRLHTLLEDLTDTLLDSGGVGLAAPQVGILKRIAVIDTTGEDPVVLINPKIIEADGEQTGYEGCLSVPGVSGQVTRPDHVKVFYLDEQMNEKEIEGTELLARALCHELDHLDGHMYTEKVIGELVDNSELKEAQEED